MAKNRIHLAIQFFGIRLCIDVRIETTIFPKQWIRENIPKYKKLKTKYHMKIYYLSGVGKYSRCLVSGFVFGLNAISIVWYNSHRNGLSLDFSDKRYTCDSAVIHTITD